MPLRDLGNTFKAGVCAAAREVTTACVSTSRARRANRVASNLFPPFARSWSGSPLRSAARTAPLHAQDAFDRRELTIPVRDGAKLFAVALVPKSMAAPLPIMLIRTPYSAAGAFRTAQLPGSYKELAEDGYIFVTEDVRGGGAALGRRSA